MVNVGTYTIHGSYGKVNLRIMKPQISGWKFEKKLWNYQLLVVYQTMTFPKKKRSGCKFEKTLEQMTFPEKEMNKPYFPGNCLKGFCLFLDLLVRCLEKVNNILPKWQFDGDLPHSLKLPRHWRWFSFSKRWDILEGKQIEDFESVKMSENLTPFFEGDELQLDEVGVIESPACPSSSHKFHTLPTQLTWKPKMEVWWMSFSESDVQDSC